MIVLDETALKCDLAETYHIYDYRKLPSRMVASFSVGLRANSRIKMKLNGNKVPYEMELLMAMVDRLSLLVYAQSKDAKSGRNKPKMLLEELYKETEKCYGFDTPDDLNKAIEKIKRGV